MSRFVLTGSLRSTRFDSLFCLCRYPASSSFLVNPASHPPSSRHPLSSIPINSSSSSPYPSHQPRSSIISPHYSSLPPPPHSPNTVHLGLGSNLGDRLANINHAIHALSRPVELGGADALLLDTSFMYESLPMYVSDQPMFLNAACKISTPLDPLALLKVIKQIELSLGRQLRNAILNGPRPIDIDILLFNQDVFEHHSLTIPHVAMVARQFVLEPLADIAPDLVHPQKQVSIRTLLSDLKRTSSSTVRRIHPLCGPKAPTLDLSTRTHVMSIVNCTPDSFSDAGEALGLPAALASCHRHVAAGADVVDIGGMSTRPGAEDVCVEEEIRRTEPVIRALRESDGKDVHISIDTFRAATAEAAVRAGATIVNDVTGGQGDGEMLKTVARLDVPIVLMHMRGNPQTMAQMATYEHGDVVGGVGRELGQRLSEAIGAGIKRWNIILDPGIGFAKDLCGNCQLLGSLDELDARLLGHPLLVGVSRKKMIGELLSDGHAGRAPQDRLMGTAAACALAVIKGARMLRVHDTAEIRDLVKVLDGIKRLEGR